MPVVIGEELATRLGNFELKKLGPLISVITNKFERTYFVLGDTLEDEEGVIAGTTGIPQVGDTLRGVPCTKVDPTEIEQVINPFRGGDPLVGLWRVKVSFDSSTDSNTNKNHDNPTDNNPDVSWTDEETEEVLTADAITGAPLWNPVWEPVLVTHQVCISVLTVVRLENYPFDPRIQILYGNKTNLHEFYGAPTGAALLKPPNSKTKVISGVLYEEVTYKTKFKIKLDPSTSLPMPDTWTANLLAQGTRYWTIPNVFSSQVLATDKHANPTKVNLNKDGTKNTSGTPYYQQFNRTTKADLNLLNLGPY